MKKRIVVTLCLLLATAATQAWAAKGGNSGGAGSTPTPTGNNDTLIMESVASVSRLSGYEPPALQINFLTALGTTDQVVILSAQSEFMKGCQQMAMLAANNKDKWRLRLIYPTGLRDSSGLLTLTDTRNIGYCTLERK